MNSSASARKRKPNGQDQLGINSPLLLLDWYDRHRRRLPWRPLPGESADPYRVWLSEIMLQQTGVKTVAPYFLKFLARWPGVDALGRASLDDVLRMWAGLGYYSRARDDKSRAGDENSRAGDIAQALMDLGSSICTPKKPACALCPLNEDCVGRARGDQESFPRKAPKKTGALRRGAAFVVTRPGELLVRTRAEKGLLGGMTEVPTSHWLAAQDDKAALGQAPRLKDIARWHRKQGTVTHVFTHFPLELVVYTASIPTRARAPTGMRWVSIATLRDEALPNVMRKVIAHGLGD